MRVLLAVIAFLACSAALAQQPAQRPPAPGLTGGPVTETAPPAGMEIVFVPQADHAVFDGTYLVLDGVSPVVPFFVERPLHISGVLSPTQFAEVWALSKATLGGPQPVATVAAISGSRTPPPVLELRSVAVEDTTMTFEARILTGELREQTGPVALIFRPRIWWPRMSNGMAARQQRQPAAGPAEPDMACFMTFAMNQSICQGIVTPSPLAAPAR